MIDTVSPVQRSLVTFCLFTIIMFAGSYGLRLDDVDTWNWWRYGWPIPSCQALAPALTDSMSLRISSSELPSLPSPWTGIPGVIAFETRFMNDR